MVKRARGSLLGMVLLIACAQPSFAQGGWVVAAYLGYTYTHPSSLTISQEGLGTRVTFREVHFEGRSFATPLYYGVRGGRFLKSRPWLGFEAEFIHLKVFADTRREVQASGIESGRAIDGPIRLDQIIQRYSISHGVNLLLFNLAARRPVGRFLVSGRFGLGPTFPHTETTIFGRSQEQYELGRAAFQAAAGAEFSLHGGLHFLSEYKFTRTRQEGEVFSGSAESVLRSHHVVFGLSYHF
jgi:opacity protein-like surface antigen